MSPITLLILILLIVGLGVLGDYLVTRPTKKKTETLSAVLPILSVPTRVVVTQVSARKPEIRPRVTASIAAQKSKKRKTKSKVLTRSNVIPEGMVLIPEGTFMMGSPEGTGLPGEHPQHQVHVKAFYMDKNLVTFDQYDLYCRDVGKVPKDDFKYGRGLRPAIGISWEEAKEYASWHDKRLPTEAEYEWAARGGAKGAYFFGNDPARLGNYAWYGQNSDDQTHPVGGKLPNPYGLYDILGNVYEWCSDWYGEGYYAVSPTDDPKGPMSGTYKVARGGGWWSTSDSMQTSSRSWADPENSVHPNGFRCVVSKP